MLTEEYFESQEKYEKIYGERTIVLFQVGSFYECYRFDVLQTKSDSDRITKEGHVWNESRGIAHEISQVINVALTMQNKAEKYSTSNLNVCGFPCVSIEKYMNVLMREDYVVVRVDQRKELVKGKERIHRYVAEIRNPAVNINAPLQSRITNNIICLYIEYQGSKNLNNHDQLYITSGISSIDITTGKCKVCEFHSQTEDKITVIQEIYRFLLSHYPRELQIYIQDYPISNEISDPSEHPYAIYLTKNL